jgi:hypothetical protein
MGDFEIWYFWDWRDKSTQEAMLPFAKFAEEIADLDLMGVNIRTIDLDNDAPRHQATIDYLRESPDRPALQKFLNPVDYTNLRRSLHLTTIPVTFFIDRRTGSIRRIEGRHSVEEYQQEMKSFLNLPAGTAWKPTPIWFVNEERKEALIHRNPGIADPWNEDIRPGRFEPNQPVKQGDVQPQSQLVVPWDGSKNF